MPWTLYRRRRDISTLMMPQSSHCLQNSASSMPPEVTGQVERGILPNGSDAAFPPSTGYSVRAELSLPIHRTSGRDPSQKRCWTATPSFTQEARAGRNHAETPPKARRRYPSCSRVWQSLARTTAKSQVWMRWSIPQHPSMGRKSPPRLYINI